MDRQIGSDFSNISLVWGEGGNGLSFLEMEGMENETPSQHDRPNKWAKKMGVH